MFTDTDVAAVRHVVQRILVPCVFVIGLLGNSVSIYVLTRRRMRCTTNIYLTALAITDIIYLTMALLLSLKHYDHVQRHWEPYWKYHGIMMWLCDACAYISIYIAVCFTIERFIAIRYPLKRQKFCTESLAKKVIIGVSLFCLLSTISTAFEHEYSVKTKLIDSDGKPCNMTLANTTATKPLPLSSSAATLAVASTAEHRNAATVRTARTTWLDYNNAAGEESALWLDGSGSGQLQGEEAARDFLPTQYVTRAVPLTAIATETMMLSNNKKNNNGGAIVASAMQVLPPVKASTLNIPDIKSSSLTVSNSVLLLDARLFENVASPPVLHMQMSALNGDELDDLAVTEKLDRQQEQQRRDNANAFNVTEYCQNVTYYVNTPSDLAQHALYTQIWYFFTLFVFVLIPLCVLATFNCFLIMLVRRSKNLRGEMTNASSMRRPKRKSNISSVSQENRVTVTLIAVVLLFIVCQLPWAIYLIISEQMDIKPNVQKIIGNIFNFLAAINAAANFFLYCVLSDKYRKTVRELITGYRYRRQHNTQHSSSHYNNNNTTASTLNGGSRRYRSAATSVVIK